MALRILLCIVLLPCVEVTLLILIGKWIGAGWTVAFILFSAIIGFLFLKGKSVVLAKELVSAVKANRVPTMESIEAVAIIIGAIFLIIPGVITDVWGLCLIANAPRKILISSLWPKLQESKFYKDLEKNLRDELIKKGHIRR